jgi:CheY-like chemotaxis protein
MESNLLQEFGTTAKSLSRNPLGIIALFIVLVYGLACMVLITGKLASESDRLPIIYFVITFPFVVIGVFTYLVAFRSGQLYTPIETGQENFLKLQEMLLASGRRVSAVASLALAQSATNAEINIADITASVDRTLNAVPQTKELPKILWVDDNPENNAFVRQTFESVRIRVVLSETTSGALDILSRQSFDAIISDMGRREGPREGYVLLDSLRDRGDGTPLFFYAGSAAVEHKRETLEHGGQGCTNDAQELFGMVTKAVFGRGLGYEPAYQRV